MALSWNEIKDRALCFYKEFQDIILEDDELISLKVIGVLECVLQ
jgi:hypothetical protein